MGRIKDTSNDITPSIHLKSNLTKNGCKENYFNKMLQEKVDREWSYRNNVYDVGEEKVKGSLKFDKIEVVMKSVYDDKNVKLSDDFKSLTFRDIKHSIGLGRRYKFSVNKEYSDTNDLNIWMVVNLETISATATAVVKRCNNHINLIVDNGTRIHSEPCIIDPTLKYVNMYHNNDVTILQATLYIILQNNEYTKTIKENDRFIIGHKGVYKVKSVNDYLSDNTFDREKNPTIILSLDKDTEADDDNFELGVANYDNYTHTPTSGVSKIELSSFEEKIYLQESIDIECTLKVRGTAVSSDIMYESSGVPESNYSIVKTGNSFKIFNHKMYNKSPLRIRFYTEHEGVTYEKSVELILGGLV